MWSRPNTVVNSIVDSTNFPQAQPDLGYFGSFNSPKQKSLGFSALILKDGTIFKGHYTLAGYYGGHSLSSWKISSGNFSSLMVEVL